MAVDPRKYLGKECKNHPNHFERWIVNRTCTLCLIETNKRYKERNKDKCRNDRRAWDINNPEKSMLQRARHRARLNGLGFDLDIADIIIPEYCPVLGIPLIKGITKANDNSPTLDRINNNLGYIKGNVVVVSYRANRIKNDSSIEELIKIVEYYRNNNGIT
jgi:hypothetical protein